MESSQRSRVDETLAQALPPLERALAHVLPVGVPKALVEFLVFGIKQAWACLFGGLLLLGMIVTYYAYPAHLPVARYDALVLYAVGLQALFLITRLERPSEALVIRGSCMPPSEHISRDAPACSSFAGSTIQIYG